ncbi:hypothetical protein BP6252_14144 [Coleophoma cylindrospora]|uniref:Uncharacterized protein n=1 Tax=Coleophoma cylindrospora TaxID=1849047 RepID=A0A3D8Q3J4_9HELO|nr:hypothetical protein BP6252_14144 [Coleophoma cylindrospora]
MAEPPFPLGDQLDNSLAIASDPTTQQPYLCCNTPNKNTLPSQPRVSLDLFSIRRFLVVDLLTPDLNRLTPHLWLVSTPRSSHISALHHQAVRGRRIVLAENPQLHLVWRNNTIFIKPLPPYLLSHAFWDHVFGHRAVSPHQSDFPFEGWQAACGFMRTYSHLVQYKTDFDLGQEIGLIPKSVEWDAFARFIEPFHELGDREVSPRYSYGELRLTRLNFYSRIFLFPKLTFHHIDAQWGAFFGNMFPVLLFIFAVLTIILASIQVELGVQQILGADVGASWVEYRNFGRRLSIAILVGTTCIIVFFLGILVFFFVHDTIFARNVLSQQQSQKSRPHVFEKQNKSQVI